MDEYTDFYEGNEPKYSVFARVGKRMRISVSTISRWHEHYLSFGELPYVTNTFLKKLQQKGGKFRKNSRWPKAHIQALEDILESNPEFYLDEIIEHLFILTGTLYSPPTISRVLWYDLHRKLIVYNDVAFKRNEKLRLPSASACS